MIDQTKRILSDLVAFPTVSADSNLDMIAYLKKFVSKTAGRRLMYWQMKRAAKPIFCTVKLNLLEADRTNL